MYNFLFTKAILSLTLVFTANSQKEKKNENQFSKAYVSLKKTHDEGKIVNSSYTDK